MASLIVGGEFIKILKDYEKDAEYESVAVTTR